MQQNLWIYGSTVKPQRRQRGQPRKLTKECENRLIQYLLRNPTANQEEMAWFIWEEYGIRVNQSTVSRFLTRIKWSRKKARRVAKRQCQQLRNDYLANMAGILAHQMVFLDETIFNEMTGWRLMAWVPIGQDGRYSGDRTRGHTWSILAAYATTGYLPCYAVKEGYYNVEAFHTWLVEEFLPLSNPFPGPNRVIILDNASSHCNPIIAEAIHARGCLVRYLGGINSIIFVCSVARNRCRMAM